MDTGQPDAFTPLSFWRKRVKVNKQESPVHTFNSKIHSLNLIFYCVLCGHTHATACNTKDSRQVSVFTFHYLGSADWTQVIRCGSKVSLADEPSVADYVFAMTNI